MVTKKNAETETSKSSATKSPAATKKARKPVDPREHVPPKPAALKKTIAAIEQGLSAIEQPAEPVRSDLVDAMIHIQICDGYPCGLGQEALRRIESTFVDRNEFRVTEAFESAATFADFDLPDQFERCKAIQESIGQVYNDQNGVTLDFLREAAISERKNFFARVPAVSPYVARFICNYVDFEEILFSDRSTQRVQVRLGLDPKAEHVANALDELRVLFGPYGHLPLEVGPGPTDRTPVLDPVLSPACLLIRLAPIGKRK